MLEYYYQKLAEQSGSRVTVKYSKLEVTAVLLYTQQTI
jgi:hypothetical protein